PSHTSRIYALSLHDALPIYITCILRSWRILGVVVCVLGVTPYTCLYVENAYPSGLFEVERQPLRSYYGEMGGFLNSFESLRFFRSEEHTSELQSPDHLVWRL